MTRTKGSAQPNKVGTTYKEKFNKKYKFPKDKSHSLNEISKITGYKLSGLKKIAEKGRGAFLLILVV
jgi:hypothetical protein